MSKPPSTPTTDQHKITTSGKSASSVELGRRLMIVRHGERVDRCFQKRMPDWVHRLFPDKTTGAYHRVNLNMPRRCLMRGEKKDEFKLLDYKCDPPLTMLGEEMAELLGSRISRSEFKFTHVYCSPSFRCIETCERILKGFCKASATPGASVAKREFVVNIEPAIYEFTGFAESQMMVPTMVSADFLVENNKLRVNKDYKPAVLLDDLRAGEEVKEFYVRTQIAIDKILKDTEKELRASVLIVSHSANMDAMCQLLTRQPQRSTDMLLRVANYPPNLASLVLEENRDAKAVPKWHLAPPPVKGFATLLSDDFQWKKLADTRPMK